MKMKYFSPMFLASNGVINMTASQLGELGITIDPDEWNDFWYSNSDTIEEVWGDFDWRNPPAAAVEAGFDINDDSTWDYLLFEP